METLLNSPINEARKEMYRIEQQVSQIAKDMQPKPSVEVSENKFKNEVVENTNTDNLVRLKENEILYKANAKVIKSAEEMIGSVIDLRV